MYCDPNTDGRVCGMYDTHRRQRDTTHAETAETLHTRRVQGKYPTGRVVVVRNRAQGTKRENVTSCRNIE